jgi:bacterial leucyl aminopeptidase
MGRLMLLMTLAVLSINAKAATNSFDGFYAVPSENLRLLPKKLQPAIAAGRDGNIKIVKLNELQVKTLARRVHETKFSCGGFMTVDRELQSMSADQLVQSLSSEKAAARQEAITLKFGGEVTIALEKTQKNRFESNLKNLSSFTDRYANSDNGVKAAEWLRDQMLKIAKDGGRSDVTAEMIATPRYKQPSVVVKLPGNDSSLPAVLIGGHFDSYENNKPAVDDDASGSITVMESFQAIIDSKLQLKRDTYFAFYAAEEWGLHGSKAVVAEFVKRKIGMRGVLQFDMTGFKSPKDKNPVFLMEDFTNPALTAFTKGLLETYVGIENVGFSKCGYGCSDHASWNKAGVAVAFPFEAAMANMNKDLHKSSDTIDKLDMDHAMQFVRLGVAFLVELGEPVTK